MYHQEHSFLAPGEVIHKLAITPGMRVAHLGCGSTGFFAVPIARIVGSEGRVYAVDILPAALSGTTAHTRLDKLEHIVEPIWANLEIPGATKIQENSLDRVLIINLLNHVTDIPTILNEASRLLKPGGIAAVIDWHRSLPAFGPTHEHLVSPESITSAARGAGLTLQKKLTLGAYHYGLLFEKK